MTELAYSPLSFAVALFIIAGCVTAAFALYPLVLSVAAFFYSESPEGPPPSRRLVVLVPAHDEAALIGRCVRSLRAQTYPSSLYEIVVIADNCSDDTAAISAAAGADSVMTRDAPDLRGKGRALRWAIDRILARGRPPDAVVIVDADSIADPGLLQGLAARLESGARAVQGTYLLSGAKLRRPSLGVISVLLMNRVRPAGFTVLGLPNTQLAGNGMLLARDLLIEHPWTAFTNVEDSEYSLILQVAGERIAFAGDALVYGETAPNAQAAAQQRLRWHGGKAYLAKAWLPRLVAAAVRDRRFSLLGVAFGLAVPPLAFLMSTIIAGTALGSLCVAVGAMAIWPVLPWLLALVSVPLSVLIGLRAAHAPRSAYAALIHAPLYVVRSALRSHRVLTYGGEKWVRTERESAPGSVGT